MAFWQSDYRADINDILHRAGSVATETAFGSSTLQDLLDRMAVEILEIRQALLSDEVLEDITQLKGFRHIVRHRYGIESTGSKVMEDVQRMEHTFPEFVAALEAIEDAFLTEPDGKNDRISLSSLILSS